MALTYGFFNAELNGGVYDRVYAAEQFAEYFSLFVKNGVFPTPATQLQVTANSTPNMAVYVNEGYGWINGYYAKNSGPYPLAVQAAHGSLNRIDAVVLRWVNETRLIELAVKTGVAASAPAMPELQRDENAYELMLAAITVPAGATNITQSQITDKRPDESVCGWVTGAVQNIDATNLFAQYDAAFKEWFDDVKAQLEGNVATNLLNRIKTLEDDVADKWEKTLSADTKTLLGLDSTAVPDDAFITLANSRYTGWELIFERTTAGSFTWTAPDLYNGQDYEIGVLVIGGGGGGGYTYTTGSSQSYYMVASGGGSGFAEYCICKITPGKAYNGVIGAGGAGARNNGSYTDPAGKGGTSSFNVPPKNIIAYGGDPGSGGSSQQEPTTTGSSVLGVNGGQGGYFYVPNNINVFGGVVVASTPNNKNACSPTQCFNPFEMRRILCAGGYVWARQQGSINFSGVGTDPYTGLHGGYGSSSGKGSTGTDPGSGGGGAIAFSYNSSASSGTYHSGAGAAGAVKIYKRKVSL